MWWTYYCACALTASMLLWQRTLIIQNSRLSFLFFFYSIANFHLPKRAALSRQPTRSWMKAADQGWCVNCWRSLTARYLRHRWHQAGQHGGADRGDNGGGVSSSPVQHLRLQQQQRDNPPLRHAGVGSLRQALQAWVGSTFLSRKL